MDQRVKRSRYDYTETFKLTVVGRIERGELSCRQAQQHYGIQGRATVLRWMRRHGRADWSGASLGFAQPPMQMEKKTEASATAQQQHQQRIKQLESQLREAREKANFFEAVLDVLKKDYGVPVKKLIGKSSNKSSSKGSA